MLYGLNENTILKIQQIFATFPQVDEVLLYGSRAKGNFKPGSDIDLTVKGKGLDLTTMNNIGLAIDDLLLPYIIDLSVYEHIQRLPGEGVSREYMERRVEWTPIKKR